MLAVACIAGLVPFAADACCADKNTPPDVEERDNQNQARLKNLMTRVKRRQCLRPPRAELAWVWDVLARRL